jgi:hypothetical protein
MKIIPDSEADLGFRFEPENYKDTMILLELSIAIMEGMNKTFREAVYGKRS